MKVTSKTAALPGEFTIELLGKSRRVRFGLRFLKAISVQAGTDTPVDIIERLQHASLSTLLDMLAAAVSLSIPDDEKPEGFDALEALEDAPADQQSDMLRTMLASISANPIFAGLRG